jgi:hypothetical protein
LYWKTTGNTTNSDIVGGNTGSITITNNQAVFNVSMNTDGTLDGTKILGIAIATGSQSGPTVVTTPTPIVVLDTSIPPVQIPLTFLAVAGGGGGSYWGGSFYGTVPGGSGGGAGGYITRTVNVLNSNVYTITVGAGGTGGWNSQSQKGSNTSISGTQLANTAFSGAGAAGPDYNLTDGPPFGSGGGSANPAPYDTATFGTPGQGNNGFIAYGGVLGGGGGGAGAAAANSIGGIGLQTSITGTSIYYAGGGGGGSALSGGSGSAGGLGGGGTGGSYNFTASQTGPGAGQNGTTNTGGGAGGGTGGQGGTGGSGVFILSVPTIYYSGTYTGSNVAVTTSGANTVLSFYSSGTYTS